MSRSRAGGANNERLTKIPAKFPSQVTLFKNFWPCLRVNIIFWDKSKGDMEEDRVRKRENDKSKKEGVVKELEGCQKEQEVETQAGTA